MLSGDPVLIKLALALLRAGGRDALGLAEAKAKEARAAGDKAGYAIWITVRDTVEEFIRGPEASDRLN